MKRSNRGFMLATVLALAVSAVAQDTGAELYKTNCQPCHGEAGDGKTPAAKLYKIPSLLTPELDKKTDAELVEFAKKGKGDMPSWSETLSDHQIQDVITYIRNLKKKSE